MSKKIFLSYNMADQGRLVSVIEKLRISSIFAGEDIEIIDPLQEVESTDDLRTKLTQIIKASDAVVLIWSSVSVGTDWSWCMYEAGLADAMDKPVIIAVVDPDAPEIDVRLSRFQVLRMSEKS
jgi:hypothetical protein